LKIKKTYKKMRSTLLRTEEDTVLESLIGSAEKAIYVVNPSKNALYELAQNVDMSPETPDIRVLASEQILKDIMDDFLVASTTADLVEEGYLDIRLLDTDPNHSVVVRDDSVYALVTIGNSVAAVGTEDEDFVDETAGYYTSMWENSDAYSLRTPSISRVRSSLSTEIGERTAEDFDAVLDSLATARGDGDDIDEVTISLLVAARNNELLYDISKWGEDVGLASKATFSRTKTKLEEMGLIDTEKVPIDVGRPRLRLKLGDERLERTDTDELASVAQSLLAA
jgi:hypothetical protein